MPKSSLTLLETHTFVHICKERVSHVAFYYFQQQQLANFSIRVARAKASLATGVCMCAVLFLKLHTFTSAEPLVSAKFALRIIDFRDF